MNTSCVPVSSSGIVSSAEATLGILECNLIADIEFRSQPAPVKCNDALCPPDADLRCGMDQNLLGNGPILFHEFSNESLVHFDF